MEAAIAIDPLYGLVKQIDCNWRTIVAKHQMKGPVCHVGSLINKKDIKPGTVERWRSIFPEPDRFVGLDMFPGPNVDVLADLCSPTFLADHADMIGKFRTVVCNALLEHVKNPFTAAANVAALIAPGGHLFFGGPWVWSYHGYPGDFFRISFDGIAELFPGLEWKQRWYFGTKEGVGLECDKTAERQVFRQYKIEGPASLLTDIGMPFLNLGAVGLKPSG